MLLVDNWYHIKSLPEALMLEPFVRVRCLHRPDLVRKLLERCRIQDLLFEEVIKVETRSNSNWIFWADRSSNPIETVVQAAAWGTIKIGRTLQRQIRLLFDLDNPDSASRDAVVFASLAVAKRWLQATVIDPQSVQVLRDATAHLSAARIEPGLWGPQLDLAQPATMHRQLQQAAKPEWENASRLAQALFAGELLLLPVDISLLLYRVVWWHPPVGTLPIKPTAVESAPVVAAPRRSRSISASKENEIVRRFVSQLPKPVAGKEQTCNCLRAAASASVPFIRL